MLVEAFLETVQQRPKSPAVADSSRALSYGQLGRLAMVMRDLIRRHTDCERVGVILPASTAFPAVLFGGLWDDRVVVPLNFLLREEELGPVVADADLEAIFTVRPFAELAGRLPARAVFLEDLPIKRKMLLAGLRRLPAAPPVPSDRTAVMLYTSGTTGAAKGVELTHRNLHGNCVDAIASLDIDPAQRFLNILPPFHVFGLTANVLVPVMLGASVYALPRFNPVAAVRAIAEQRLTAVLAIPSMYAAMLRTKSAGAEAFRSVQLAISGGEPLSGQVRSSFEKRFGVQLHEGYGLTETSPVISACAPGRSRPGTVGKPLRNVELRILGMEGQPASSGEDGEIYVRGPGVMKGYFRRPEDTAKVIDSQGWFHTGDIGRLDEDGFLSITGRAKEMLIIGGENVFPREIEAALEAHEGVAQAAVIGVPDDLRGEAPVAFLIPRDGAAVREEELRSFVKKSLAGYKVPRRIIVREDLPTGPTGKILKRKLKELL